MLSLPDSIVKRDQLHPQKRTPQIVQSDAVSASIVGMKCKASPPLARGLRSRVMES